MNTDDLAKKVKVLRSSRGMSQEFLAEEARVSLRTIQRIENEESEPTGETIKRIATALDVSLETLIGKITTKENSSLTDTIIFFKKLLSKTNKKTEVKIFKNYISLLTELKKKELAEEQYTTIESYLKFLELEKIPSYSIDLYKDRLKKFKKHLKSNLKFVPNNLYGSLSISFAVPFAISFWVQKNLSTQFKLIVSILCIMIIAIGHFVDYRIKKQGRSLKF